MKVESDNTTIRNVTAADASTWEALRTQLWPDGADDHAKEIAEFFAGTLEEPDEVMFLENSDGAVLAYAELAIREDVAGLEGKRVGYVEALYVLPEVRHRGLARKLLVASREWARQQECAGFASDRAGRVIVDETF